MAPSPTTDSCVGAREQSDSWNTPLPVLCSKSSVKPSISKSPLFCKKGLTATLSYSELCVANHAQLMVLYNMYVQI